MNSSASAPSRTTWTRLARLCVLKACSASLTSLGLSSTSKMTIGASGMRDLTGGPSEEKGRSLVGPGIGPDPSTMSVNDSLHDRQPHARSFVVLGAVQTLKHAKQLV